MSDGKILPGQEYIPEFDFVAPFTQQMHDDSSLVGTDRVDVQPNDRGSWQTRTYDIAGITTQLDAYVAYFYGNTVLDLPDELTAIVVIYQPSSGDGSYSESGAAFVAGPGTASLSLNGESSCSAAIVPEIIPSIIPRRKDFLRYTDYFFFVPKTRTRAQIVTHLNSVASITALDTWPASFKATPVTIVAKGQSISIQTRANAHFSATTDGSVLTAFASGGGAGNSTQVDVTIRAVTMSPVYRAGTITPTGGTSSSIAGTAQSAVDISCSLGGGSSGDSGLLTATASASITPTTVAATAVAIPATGLYIINLDSSPYRYGYIIVRARVINAADL